MKDKDVVKAEEIEMWELPEPHHRFAGVIFDQYTTTTKLGAGIVILPVGQQQHISAHKAEEIYYILRGKGQFLLGKRVVDVEKGTAVHVAPNVEHQGINTGDEEMVLYFVLTPPESAWPAGWIDFLKGRGWKKRVR